MMAYVNAKNSNTFEAAARESEDMNIVMSAEMRKDIIASWGLWPGSTSNPVSRRYESTSPAPLHEDIHNLASLPRLVHGRVVVITFPSFSFSFSSYSIARHQIESSFFPLPPHRRPEVVYS